MLGGLSAYFGQVVDHFDEFMAWLVVLAQASLPRLELLAVILPRGCFLQCMYPL